MNNQSLLKYFLLFVLSFSLFSYFQISPTFPDPDSFYHAKMAVLTRDQGIVTDFPWLQFTVLKDNYANHHFLYHLVLVPFVTFLDPIVGIKLATATFAAVLILIFYWFLQKCKIKGALFYSLLLLTLSPFIFRINLAKAGSFSVIILLIGLYFIFNRKIWPLFILSFFYVWTYGGWPLILVLTLFYILSDSLIKTFNRPQNKKLKIGHWRFIRNLTLEIRNFVKGIFSKPNIKLFFSCFAGLASGIVINPYFPQNLIFYWHQIVKIAVINYRGKINVGAEWYPYSFGDLVANSSFVFVLLVLAFAALFVNLLKHLKDKKKIFEKDKAETLTIAILTFFFLALTLRSRRNVEYFIPFAVLLAAFVLNQPFSRGGRYWLSFQKWWRKRKILGTILCLYFLFIIPFTAGRNIWATKKLFNSGSPTNKYQGVSKWLKNNTPEEAIIFHNDWDDFPALFYYNTNNYYIAGLDPTFMYDYNKYLHKKWVLITTGKQDKISEIVRRDFNSQYVFVDKDHIALENNLKRDGNFAMVYKDEEGKIYQLTNSNNK
jgi:hypothetical protein